MSRRRSELDPDFDPEVANHAGEMMQGSIVELRTKDPRDKTWEKLTHYDGSGRMGFVIDRSAYRRRRRRK